MNEVQRMLAGYPHYHCSAGCQKIPFEKRDGAWVCARCYAPRVKCNDDICDMGETA